MFGGTQNELISKQILFKTEKLTYPQLGDTVVSRLEEGGR